MAGPVSPFDPLPPGLRAAVDAAIERETATEVAATVALAAPEPGCGNCRFWSGTRPPATPQTKGYCVRFPPPGGTAMMPRTMANHWCGEYQEE